MKTRFVAALAVAAMALPAAANAALVYDNTITASGQGFGNAPRLLTIQGGGSGCVTCGPGCPGPTASAPVRSTGSTVR